MSIQNEETFFEAPTSVLSLNLNSIGKTFLRRMLGDLECGELVIETPSRDQLLVEGRRSGAQARLNIHSWRLLGRLVSGWDIGFAEAYIAAEWSSPNLVALLTLACTDSSLTTPLKMLRSPRFWLKFRHAMNRNTRRGSRRNIAAHYDLGNEFYEKWLDAGMNYSAGLFSSPDQTLEGAQHAKLDRVLSLLDLSGREKVLEIGCGWGGLAEQLLQKHDCSVTGITLSAEQLAYARRRLRADVVAGRCDLRLQDYRDVQGGFDRIVSIEMLEAVGEAYWPTYFEKLRSSLRSGGSAVLQVITLDEDRFEKYRRRPDFIQKYIFPGGMLPTPRTIEWETAKAGLRIVAKKCFGDGYARTLKQWRLRFQGAWPEIKALGFDEHFKRMWEYYLAYCQVGFETGAINVGLYKLARAADT